MKRLKELLRSSILLLQPSFANCSWEHTALSTFLHRVRIIYEAFERITSTRDLLDGGSSPSLPAMFISGDSSAGRAAGI